MIEEGTRILLIDSEGKRFIATASRRMLEVSRLGVVDGSAICDSSYGDELKIGGREFTLLKPSLKDLLGIIERRAQIMIPKDSFPIPLHLDLGAGCTVIEGGVGSGALALVLLKTISPAGRVFSFDNRLEHADIARRNVSMSNYASCWELKIADICTADLPKAVDAAVLDIPNPWDAVANVASALKIGGHMCCYVPNANQLEKAVRKMRDEGLTEISSFETIQREMVVHDGGVRPSFDTLGHTGYLAFARKLKVK